MKNAYIALIAGLTLMAGASAFAKDGGGADGGSRTFELSAAHTQQAMDAYAANQAAHSASQVASVQK
jgi:hypothetical protein